MIKAYEGTVIAGPCQIENVSQGIRIAEHCKKVCDSLGYDYYFKASFDKANRSHASSDRGMGFVLGSNAIQSVAESTKVKTCVDFHDIRQIKTVFKWGKLPDIIQIPAFLCRQTDLIREAVNTGAIVNIKKGQFLAPWDVAGILSKTGMENVMITERGSCFGYNNLVVDFTGLVYMIKEYQYKHGVPIVFDGTHCVQKPGGLGQSSGGNREYVPYMLRAAASVGVYNFFMEVHEEPDKSPSDGPNILRLEDFEGVLKSLKRLQNSI
jgi:2-dehydro-3-deoxyphosphooctonate aldolase (KDO 8-P synthase)